jgi:hypothetical protein
VFAQTRKLISSDLHHESMMGGYWVVMKLMLVKPVSKSCRLCSCLIWGGRGSLRIRLLGLGLMVLVFCLGLVGILLHRLSLGCLFFHFRSRGN